MPTDQLNRKEITMPFVSRDGITVSFKTFPAYFDQIQSGAKKADIRVLDKRWSSILTYAERIIFYTHAETLEKKITGLHIWPVIGLGTFVIKNLFADVNWEAQEEEEGKGLKNYYAIIFEDINPTD